MNFEKIISELKSRQIPLHMLTKAAKGGYICICGNGSGDKGTGATLSKDGTRLLCGKQCGHSKGVYSYIDIAAHYYNIDLTNFVEGFNQLCQVEGIEIDNYSDKNKIFPHANEKTFARVKEIDADTLKQKQAAENFLQQSQGNLKEFLDSRGGKYRAIGYDVLNFLNWQYCPNYKHTNNNFTFPAVLIPNDNGGLLARQIDGKTKSNLKPSGTSTIYLPKNPKFILAVEGAINGASILQALGLNLDFAIIASNGTPNKDLLVKKILELFPNKNIPVAVAFDTDVEKNGKRAGQDAAVDVLNQLIKAGYTACMINITKTEGIDLNDILRQENGEIKLAQMLDDSLSLAQTEFDKIERAKTQELFGESGADYFKDNQFMDYLDDKKQFADRVTGFSNLDDEMNGLLPGMYIIGGLSALGKTTFVWQLLEQMSRNGEHCFFCSYEMAKGELYCKTVAREVYKIESNNFNSSPEKVLTASNISKSRFYEHHANFDTVLNSLSQELTNLRVWEIDKPNIDDLLGRLEKICAKLDKPPIVAIDYLQLLAAGCDNVKNVLDGILLKLKTFQRKTNSTFFIVSSLNRANYNTEISFQAFKESGNIEFSADCIWGLQLLLDGERNHKNIEKAKKDNPRQIQLKCLKNRFGRNFDVGFYYYPKVDYFKPMNEETYSTITGEYTECPENAAGIKTKIKGRTKDGDPKF